jgi:proline racemase
VTKPSSMQLQPENSPDGQAMSPSSFVRRTVSVEGSGGIAATVVVIAQQGRVWVSIQPRFTWEAIMEPGKVDELIHTLALAREDAKKMLRYRHPRHPER